MPAQSPHFKRAILKISGESFSSSGELGIDPDELNTIARQIADAANLGTELAVVVGGGNIIRGVELAARVGIAQATADYMGMLATVINALALKEALEQQGQPARVMSALDIESVAEPFIRGRALRHFEKGRVLILAAGTGNPFFTTDSAASLRAIEIGADLLIKATKVDGVYSADPTKFAEAVRYDRLDYDEVLSRKLDVMDATAVVLCRDNRMPMRVVDMTAPGSFVRAALGEDVGTLVTAQENSQ